MKPCWGCQFYLVLCCRLGRLSDKEGRLMFKWLTPRAIWPSTFIKGLTSSNQRRTLWALCLQFLSGRLMTCLPVGMGAQKGVPVVYSIPCSCVLVFIFLASQLIQLTEFFMWVCPIVLCLVCFLATFSYCLKDSGIFHHLLYGLFSILFQWVGQYKRSEMGTDGGQI